jgi:hypothetical protein
MERIYRLGETTINLLEQRIELIEKKVIDLDCICQALNDKLNTLQNRNKESDING